MSTYNPASSHAEEFICDEEILETLEYAARNKGNRGLIEEILNKAASLKGLTHREAAVLLDCDIEDLNEKMFQLAQRIDAQLYLASVQSDAEYIDIASVPGFVIDESGFSTKPSVGRKRKSASWRRIKQSTGDFWDGLTHGMKKLLR